ncbi:toll/interleukin-1 receptor domain-containing protein [Erythrobacter sp. BLCC-B19]|uniref:toll/interleukin-1 receptor domain-containing protein n=1 Tax=Erythrobacter sp. BLCC-B19 TaxID=3025315 RepID=UPI0023623D87|nr:toll/interleukin-1 receptor domain-containing protein [Erythrobacter sp. BLCC-B19]WDA41515.1 toll/interleukin-1 receptor domain-containing protein [Erythrobacter sp. BLCC-B19]
MTQQGERLKPIGFWSYARQDDEASDGRLSRLRAQLSSELQQMYGRDRVQLWQDVAAIPPGTEWETAIDEAIAQSTFLIPLITPAFVESEYCCKEVAKFLEREAQINAAYPELKGQRRIFPIVYIDADQSDPFDPATIACLSKLQFVDFRKLREDDDPQQIRKALVRLSGEIARLLKVKVRRALTAEELAQIRLDEQAALREAERFEAERAAEMQRAREEQRQRHAAQQAARAEKQRQRADRLAGLRAYFDTHRNNFLGLAMTIVTAAIILAVVQITADPVPATGSPTLDDLETPYGVAGTPSEELPGAWLIGTWAIKNEAVTWCSHDIIVSRGMADDQLFFEFPADESRNGGDTIVSARGNTLETSGYTYTRLLNGNVEMQGKKDRKNRAELIKCAS